MPRTIGLTSRQAQVLDAIDTLTHANGYPPTVREIASYVGLASPSSVHYHLVTLQEAGLVTHPPERPRTWLTRSTEPALR